MSMTYFDVSQGTDDVRRGALRTRRGSVATPFFMPDATRASVRGLTVEQLSSVGIVPMVVNTYHLLLAPGAEQIAAAGGVHTFMQWSGPLLSDSGGYQVYSLIHKNNELGEITEEGAVFRSVLDGTKHLLTPERSIAIQFDLGVDMMVVLDDPRPNTAPAEEMRASVERTIRWAERCRKAFDVQIAERGFTDETRPLLFAVVQGGKDPALRRACAEALQTIGFDGYSFGGRHVDETGAFMTDVVRATAAALPEDAPRFALGVGTPQDIVRCAALGWDFFDCVIPTREGRHGRIFTFTQEALVCASDNDGAFYDTYNITNAQYTEDRRALEDGCDCYACTTYTRAYIQHLFRVGEPLGAQMAALHNLRFYMRLMERLGQEQH